MLLRIIDNPGNDKHEDTLQIILEHNDKTDNFVTESYNSPITDNFRKTLEWYFKDYPCNKGINEGTVDVVEKLIKFGQYLGDELLGEDHQLMKFEKVIEGQGYANLHVQIESARVEFFQELWEITILPQSKYVLSAVVKSYVRQLLQDDLPNHYPELRYDLKVTTPVQHNVTKFLHNDNDNDNDNVEKPVPINDKPLRVLYVIARPVAIDLPFGSSRGIHRTLEAIATGGVIDYEVRQLIDWDELQRTLADKTRPVHLFHYDGPVVVENGEAYFILEDSTATGSLISMEKLCSTLVDNNVGGLFVDACTYIQHNHSISAAEGLAIVARCAHQQGLGNIIGLGQIINPWSSEQCFNAIYAQIARGFSLAQAVVEARKVLQANVETGLFGPLPQPYHLWSLLMHYSKQAVIFFESPQALTDARESQGIEPFRNRLFGFKAEMLPPLLDQVSDGQMVLLNDQLRSARQLGHGQCVSIIGEPGTGKSQLAHMESVYLAQKLAIDYGFYFNFSDGDYTATDILEMIAPVFGVMGIQLSEVEEKLKNYHCCFVLDDIPFQEDAIEDEILKPLHQLLEILISSGHIVIMIGSLYSALHKFATINIKTNPLSLIEQKIISADILRQSGLAQERLIALTKNHVLENLLITLNGHPWLTKKLMPLLRTYEAGELTAHVEQNINMLQQGSQVEQFYQWQWGRLKPVWQKLLILSSSTHGLLLELLITAADQKEPFIPVSALFSLLNEPAEKFSNGLTEWESAGFLSRLPHGRIVDPRCLSFLATKRAACFDGVDQQKLQFHFSQLICEGIRLLSQHVIKQPNTIITNHLLFNRRHWVEHFERLWFGQDYSGFIAVKSAFDSLLRQAKLGNESAIWTLDLLNRSPLPADAEKTSTHGTLCWLVLATGTLDHTEASNNECILKGIEHWRSWFDALSAPLEKEQMALFQQVVIFLEKFYQTQSDWQDCVTVCEKTFMVYSQYDAWHKVIQSLKSLSRYSYELGDKERTLAFENRIINDIPYEDSPPGFQMQQMVDILLARLSRSDAEQTQLLLDQLKNTKDAENFVDMFDGIQCDIHYLQENYEATLPYYCKIWMRALDSRQQAQLEQLKPRLIELEQKVGTEYFNNYFDKDLPEGTVKPQDYVSSLH